MTWCAGRLGGAGRAEDASRGVNPRRLHVLENRIAENYRLLYELGACDIGMETMRGGNV